VNTRKLTRATNVELGGKRNVPEIVNGAPREWRDAPNRRIQSAQPAMSPFAWEVAVA
jgi:hypothetical protein